MTRRLHGSGGGRVVPARRRGALAIATSLVLAGALAACSGSDDREGRPDDGGARTLEEFSVAGSLAQLPVPDDEAFSVVVADVAAVRDANGLEVPDLDDADALADYLLPMTGNSPEAVALVIAPFNEQAAPPAVRRDAVGLSWVEADQVAAVSAPPQEFTWYGYADGAEPADGLTDLGDGVLSYGDGDDLETDIDLADSDDGGDRLGRPLRIGVDGDQAVVALTADEVTAWRDGPAATLADDDGLAALADVLDDAGAVSATVARFPGRDDALTTIGIGWTVTDGEPGFVVAYDLGDDATATAGVAAAEAAFADEPAASQLAVTSVEPVGRVLLVTGTQVERIDAPYRLLLQLDLPAGF